MNVTQTLENAIKANDKKAKADEDKAQLGRARAAIVENPWGEKNRNITRQCMIGAEFPELADVLKAHPAYSLPELYPLLPDYGKKAVGETIATLKRDGVGD